MSDYDEELRWRLELLKAEFEAGKIHIAPHLAPDMERSLSAVRYGPDGKIDLATVDGRVRSMALMAAAMHNREKEKEAISLFDISNTYMEYVEKNLEFLANKAKEKGYNAAQFAYAISENPAAVDDLAPQLPKFLEALQGFWENVADASHYHIQDLQASKAIYGGDLFPSYQSNIASTAGLYIDTIVLSDPFWNTRHVFSRGSPKQRVYYLVKHAVSVLQYRDLVTTDLDNPIVTFSPFKSSVDDDEAKFTMQIATADALKHAEALYGRAFTDDDELWKFSKSLDTPTKVAAAVKDPSRLVFDVEWDGSLEDQISRALRGEEWTSLSNVNHAGYLVAAQCIGRMGQATDLLLKSRYLSGVPLVEAPTSWKYFNWKLEYNSAIEPHDHTHLHMVRGLQHASETDEQWLGNIPPSALIEMRRKGAFEEIRNVLAKGVGDLATANPNNFFRTSDKIVDNIRDAFQSHMKEVNELRKKKIKFAGHDLGSMIAAGAIDIASIAIGTPTFGAASFAVNQLVDVPKLREIPERFRKLKNAHTELKKSPMGLLFRHKT